MLDETEKVTAAEANRDFSLIYRRVMAGETIVITDSGQDVAVIGPAVKNTEVAQAAAAAAREQARQRLMERLRNQPALNLPKYTRDELYDDALG